MTTGAGIHWLELAFQLATFLLIVVLPLALAIWATVVSLRVFRGLQVPVWILVCWFLPVVGPIAALVTARKAVEPNVSHGA